MEPVGSLRCLSKSVATFDKQFIDGVHGLQTVSSKVCYCFLTNNLSMGSMGYKRCPQKSVTLFNKQFIDGVHGLQTVSSTNAINT